MTWIDEFGQQLSYFFDVDVVKIITTILSIGVLIVTIISKTSIGKKALNKLQELINSSVKRMNKISEDYETFKAEKEKEILQVRAEYERLIEKANQKYDQLEKLILTALNCINNKGVKDTIADYIEKEGENDGTRE